MYSSSCQISTGISTNVTPTNRVLDVNTDDFLTIPPPTEEKSAVTVVALGKSKCQEGMSQFGEVGKARLSHASANG